MDYYHSRAGIIISAYYPDDQTGKQERKSVNLLQILLAKTVNCFEMIIYNVTIKVDWSVHDEWLPWMKKVHIPEMLGTGMFYEYRIVRLLQIDDTEGPTYAIQYYSRSIEDLNRYVEEFSTVQRQKGLEKWGDRFIAFRSVMEVIH